MRYRNPVRGITNGLSGGIVLIGVVLALAFGGFNLVIFFIALAVAIFVGSLGSLNPRRIYGGIIGAMWMIILALFFLTHFWLLFIIGAALSAILGALVRPLMALLLGIGIFGLASTTQRSQQPYYQSPQQPQQQPYYQPQQYQQGYQPTPQAEAYQEDGQLYQYPPQQQYQQYEQPQAQYPQELPPQQ